MLCAVALCVLTVGTISVYALVGGTDIKTGRETKAATESTTKAVTDLTMGRQISGIVEAKAVSAAEATTTKKTTTATKQTTKETTQATTEATTTTKKTTTTKAATKATTKAVTEKITKAAVTTAKKTQKVTTTAKKTTGSVISYTDEEFTMMCYVLQNEAGNLSDKSKIAVSNVIINRVKSPRFANSISGVLTAEGQFTAISNYYNKTNPPTEHTKECVLRALNGEDYSNGALFYYAPKYCGGSTAAWFESLTFCMELEGQRFFK